MSADELFLLLPIVALAVGLVAGAVRDEVVQMHRRIRDEGYREGFRDGAQSERQRIINLVAPKRKLPRALVEKALRDPDDPYLRP
jgi:hypothetical protein